MNKNAKKTILDITDKNLEKNRDFNKLQAFRHVEMVCVHDFPRGKVSVKVGVA